MPGNNHRDDLEFAPIPSYEDFSQESEIPFRKNQKVRHGKFGEGMIMAVEGAGESACVHVVFSDRIRRVLMIKFAKLEIL